MAWFSLAESKVVKFKREWNEAGLCLFVGHLQLQHPNEKEAMSIFNRSLRVERQRHPGLLLNLAGLMFILVARPRLLSCDFLTKTQPLYLLN